LEQPKESTQLNKKNYFLFIGSQVLAILLFAPWLYHYLQTIWMPWVPGPKLILYSHTAVAYLFSPGHGISKLSFLAFLLWGLAVLFRQYRSLGLFIAIILIASYSFSFLATKGNFFHYRYVFFLLPFYLLIAALGIDHFTHFLRDFCEHRFSGRRFPKFLHPAGLSIFLVLLIAANTGPDLKQYYEKGADYLEGDWRGAIQCIQANTGPNEKIALIVPLRYKANVMPYWKEKFYPAKTWNEPNQVTLAKWIYEATSRGQPFDLLYFSKVVNENEAIMSHLRDQEQKEWIWLLWLDNRSLDQVQVISQVFEKKARLVYGNIIGHVWVGKYRIETNRGHS
jgi:hypothetical protein